MSSRPVSVRLLERLVREGIVPDRQDLIIQRNNPSRSMRENGAWAWWVRWGGGRTRETAGSQWPMADCLAAPSLDGSRNDFGEVSVDPYTHAPGHPDRKLYFGKSRRRR